MSTVHNESIIRSVIKKVSAYIPQVEKPKKKITLTEKFVWSGIALFAYLVMGQIPLYGVTSAPQFDFLQFARVIFAAQQGTLLELGIGPIVTAGLLMQLLKGSDLIKLNFKNPDDRSLFTSATKIVTIIVIIAEGSLYGVSVYGGLLSHPSLIPVLIGQLIGASIVVMYLDELIQKGWGLGSGISLFIWQVWHKEFCGAFSVHFPYLAQLNHRVYFRTLLILPHMEIFLMCYLEVDSCPVYLA